MKRSSLFRSGFTLVEMLVVAPIVILAIGAFIALIVNLTGEALSSRGSNVLAYNVQDALNRIEDDVKLSAGFLATNNITFTSSNPQGRGAVDSTTNFAAVDPTYGQALILNTYATNGNPISLSTGLVYLANQPNGCTDYTTYSKNRPMTTNIIYFIDSSGTLWRRVVMPANYADSSSYCGSAPWQQPSCMVSTSRSAFCKTNDEKLLDNVGTSGLSIQYYTSASASSPLTITSSSTTTDLQPATTVVINLTGKDTIAGRSLTRTGTLRVSRLDTNASAVGDLHLPTTVPGAPAVASNVSNGHQVAFSWPAVANATGYTFQYKVNGGSFSAPVTLDANTRTYTVSAGWNGDTVQAQVTATNNVGASSAGTASTVIPVWTALPLQNGWTDYLNGYGTAAYTRTKTGVVLLRGLIKNPTTSSPPATIAKLPSDYAPDNGRLLFGVSSSTGSADGAGRIDVLSDGTVSLLSGTGYWLSLETIRYDQASTAPSPYARTGASFLNGWSNYGGGYAPATYAQDPTTKRVFLQGLIKGGTIADGTALFSLPAALQSSQYYHMSSYSTSWAHIGISSSVMAKGTGTNGFLSVNAIYYPDSSATWTAPALQGGWVNYGSPFATAGYTISANETNSGSTGLVSLKGLIKAGSTTRDSVLFTLPAGYRPKNRILYATANTAAYARLDILSNGEVHFLGSSNGWFSLDDVIFLGEQ